LGFPYISALKNPSIEKIAASNVPILMESQQCRFSWSMQIKNFFRW